jgi:hypothetical protein
MKKIIKTPTGDRLEVSMPDNAAEKNIFLSFSDLMDDDKPKKGVKYKEANGPTKYSADELANMYYSGQEVPGVKIKKIESGKDAVGLIGALANNVARGMSFGASRHLEKNKEAQDVWNDKHPFLSTGADLVGGIPLFALPGIGAAKAGRAIMQAGKLGKAIKTLAGTSKIAKFFGKSKAVKAGLTASGYSGIRSNIESRDWDPENVGKNTVRAAAFGLPLGMIASKGGSLLSKAISKRQTKAANIIEKIGGQNKFKNLTEKNAKLIYSDDPAITDLIKSANLTPKDKAVIVDKYQRLQGNAPKAVKSALDMLAPTSKNQEETMSLMKALVNKRYGMADLDMPVNVKASKTVMKAGPTGKIKVELQPDDRFFQMASKRAAQRSPSSELDSRGLSNNMTTKQLVAVRKELYDMQQQYLGKNHKLDAKEIGDKIKEINSFIEQKNPLLSKADKAFARMKNVEKGYEAGKEFKGFEPGSAKPKSTASFQRGLWDQVKANQSNLGNISGVSDFNKIVPNHIKNFLGDVRPKALGRAEHKLGKLGREQANLESLIAKAPEYQDALNTHGSDILRMMIRPKMTASRQAGKLLNSAGKMYEYNPQEMSDMLYKPARKVYKDITKAAAPTKKGKVLDTVLQSFAKTGGRSFLNRRKINGI